MRLLEDMSLNIHTYIVYEFSSALLYVYVIYIGMHMCHNGIGNVGRIFIYVYLYMYIYVHTRMYISFFLLQA